MSISSINYALFEALSVVFRVSTLKHEKCDFEKAYVHGILFCWQQFGILFLVLFLAHGQLIVLNCFDILVTIVHNLLVGWVTEKSFCMIKVTLRLCKEE